MTRCRVGALLTAQRLELSRLMVKLSLNSRSPQMSATWRPGLEQMTGRFGFGTCSRAESCGAGLLVLTIIVAFIFRPTGNGFFLTSLVRASPHPDRPF